VNEQVVVIEEFGPIPNDGIQYSTEMAEEMRETITDAFLAIAETEEGVAAMESVYEWTEVVRQDDSFYDPFRQVLEAAGVDLSDYLD
jgi:phosphonate transport system substrate-binding protein